MSKTHMVSCTCKSEYQDRLYGKGQRVANVQDKSVSKGPGANSVQAECTVCKKPHTVWR